MNLLKTLVAWGSVAVNWLKRFFKYVWGLIKSYWPYMKKFLKELLVSFVEIIILDGRQSGGSEMIDALRESRPDEILEDIHGMVSIAVNDDGSIGRVSDIDAQANEEDQYDLMAQRNNGIIRING